MKARRNYTPAFKAEVALAALKGDQTIVALSRRYQVHPQQIYQWKRHLVDHITDIFHREKMPSRASTIEALHAKIGQLSMENDLLYMEIEHQRDTGKK
jgi:transposase-like protein